MHSTHRWCGGVTAFKYSAGAAARTMPTYDDGTCNTLTADWHAPAIAVQTGHTGRNGSGIDDIGLSYTVSTSSDQAVALSERNYACMASGAAHAEIEVGGVSPTLTAHARHEAPLLAMDLTCSRHSARRTASTSSLTTNPSTADDSYSNPNRTG